MPFLELGLAIGSAVIPAVVWYYILRQKKHAHRLLPLLVAFVLAALGAVAFWYWRPFEAGRLLHGLLPLAAATTAAGIAIEYSKNLIVRLVGVGFIRDIDDIIDLSFAAALGFSFGENAVYFFDLFTGQVQAAAGNPVTSAKYFLLHALFIPPIHLFCSGLFGYFYGKGRFAAPALRQAESRQILYRLMALPVIFLPEALRYRFVKTAQGTLVSVLFFGSFFTLLQRDPQVSDLLALMGLPQLRVDEQLMPLVAFLFFKAGSLVFFLLVDRKKRHQDAGHLLEAA